MATVRALGLTLFLAFGWPFFLALIGWELNALPFSSSFSQAAGAGMLYAAGVWIVFAFM